MEIDKPVATSELQDVCVCGGVGWVGWGLDASQNSMGGSFLKSWGLFYGLAFGEEGSF